MARSATNKWCHLIIIENTDSIMPKNSQKKVNLKTLGHCEVDV